MTRVIFTNKAFIFFIGIVAVMRIIGAENVIFLHPGCFSLMNLINSSISFEISEPALYGASFVPTYKVT